MRRGRAGAFGKGLAPISKVKCLKVVSRTVAIRSEADKFGKIVCQLQKDIYVPSDNEKMVEGILWYKLPCGWLCSMDSNGYESIVVANDTEGQKQWAAEFDKRRRIGSAICAMLARSYSIENGRRVAKAIHKHVNSDQMGPMMNLPDVSMEDLMVGLSSCSGLRQGEILEIIKIAACQQCNPPKALKDIATDVLELISMRPTLWISTDRNVLETMDTTSKNDQFIMAAARGDIKQFERFLAIGQELAAVHSELKYTALHAAADFGQDEIASRLIRTGMSMDIRDARKGQTPLHFAGQGGRNNIAKLLLQAGADRAIESYTGVLPYQLAMSQGFLECAEILKFPPPEVRYVTVTNFTTRSISLRWDVPQIDPSLHARPTEYIVDWTPAGDPAIVGHGDQFRVVANTFMLKHLRPATGHGLVVRSNSPAGVSSPSSKIIQFCKSSPPDAPPVVEMLRVSVNGVYLSWHAPKYTNGAKIDRFQLELVDCEKGRGIVEREEAAAAAKLEAKQNRINANRENRRNGMSIGSPSVGSVSSGSLGLGFDDESDDEPEQPPADDDDKDCDGDDDFDDGLTMSSSIKDAGSVPPVTRSDGTSGNEINHRIFKVSASTTSKQCMGLAPWKPYQCRVRCRNSLGYSDWSAWIGPVTPQPGVYVLEFDREIRAVRVGWFKPMLAPGRKVSGYEVQLCNIMGPVTASLPVFADKDDKAHIIAKNQTVVWTTISNEELAINEFVVTNLKAGSKYQVRVRTQIDGKWLEWALALISDTILMPACAPENPFDIRVALKNIGGMEAPLETVDDPGTGPPLESCADVATDEGDEGDADWVVRAMSEAHIHSPIIDSLAAQDFTSAAAKFPAKSSERSADDYELTHDSLILCWQNGTNNGSPVIEYALEGCKIREYRASDVGAARTAAGVGEVWDGADSVAPVRGEAGDDEEKIEEEDCSEASSDDDASSAPEGSDAQYYREVKKNERHANTTTTTATTTSTSIGRDNTNSASSATNGALQWTSFLPNAAMLGPQAFRVSNLQPGASYAFRLRVRNEYGWSAYSIASPLITTFPCLPVQRPELVKTGPYSVYIRWNEQGDGGFMGLTNLEFDVEIGKIPSGENQKTFSIPWCSAEASLSPEAAKDPTAPSSPPEPRGRFVAVLLNNLSPSTDYCVRVRVRTVLGWSTWSQVSETFRTLAAPC